MTSDYLDEIYFEDQVEDYILEMDIQGYSSNTLKTYKSILDNFYKFILSDRKIKDEKGMLRAFKRYLQYLKREKEVSTNYIYLVTVVLKKFFEFAEIHIYEEIKAPKRTKSLPKSLNEQEVYDLIHAKDNEYDPRKDFV